MAVDNSNLPLPPVRTVLLARRVPVWSKGGAAPGDSAVFVLSPERMQELAPLVESMRVTMTIENATTAFACRPVVQGTDDAITWDDPVNLDTSKSGDGTWTSEWTTGTSFLRRALRIGVIASQSGTETTIQHGRVTLVADFRLKS